MREYDALVVGAGLTGSCVAKTLSMGGMEVAILDAGPVLPQDFFSVDAEAPSLNLWTRAFAVLKGRGAVAKGAYLTDQTWPLYVDRRKHPYTTPRGRPFNWVRGRQVGGRSHTWGRIALRMSDADLHAADEDGFGPRWPIEVTELAPYYDLVEEELMVDGPTDVPAEFAFLETNRPRTVTENHLRLRAILEKRLPQMSVFPARCAGHEPAPYLPPLQKALDSGRTTLFADKLVAKVSLSEDGRRALGVETIDRLTRERKVFNARVIVLAASSMESVRVLLNSGSSQHPAGLGNSSGLLGTGIMDHVRCCGFFHSEALATGDASDQGPSDLITLQRQRGFYIPPFFSTASRPGFLRRYGVQGVVLPTGWVLVLPFGEMLPHRSNRVTLNRNVVDAWGIPTLHIDVRWSDNEHRMWGHQKQTIRRIKSAVGGRVRLNPRGLAIGWNELKPHPPGDSVHESGGAGMGADPAHSVVNSFNQLWDVPNVFVCDAAVFPTIGFQNTTLTAMALATRSSEFILSQTKEGLI